MAPFPPRDWIPSNWHKSSQTHAMRRELDAQGQDTDLFGVIAPHHAHVMLIVAATSATVSLIAVLVTLRWFAMMKRRFRHHLIMLLIMSDMFKALWYLIFPLVVFTRGPVNSSSNFCQASGFFIALGTEASDFAILMIALHLVLCVFGPSKPQCESGLYTYRRWVYPFWVILPLLAASLAFTNPGNGYVTAGTFCYLPRRPLWYRLALAWVPRYIVFMTLFAVGGAITISVHVKFKGFSNLGDERSSYGPESRQPTMDSYMHPAICSPTASNAPSPMHSPKHSLASVWQHLVHHDHGRIHADSAGHKPDWAGFGFGSSVPLTQSSTRTSQLLSPGETGRDFDSSVENYVPPLHASRPSMPKKSISDARSKEYKAASRRVSFANETRNNSTAAPPSMRTDAATEELDTSRHAIERHLRLLFIYPVAYTLIWVFPFISHCLQYTDRYADEQPFWLVITVTTILALQAGVDAAVFSYRERPWKRPRGQPLISMKRLRGLKFWDRADDEKGKQPAETPEADAEGGGGCEIQSARPSVNWWEEEGKKRRDSVWMGTDTLYVIKSRQEEAEKQEEAIE